MTAVVNHLDVPITRRSSSRRPGRRTRCLAVLLAGVALSLAACGGSKDDSAGAKGATTDAPTSTEARIGPDLTTTTTAPAEPKTVAEAKARAAVLVDGDVGGYTARGSVASESGTAPLSECVQGLDVVHHTLAQASGPKFSSDDGKIEIGSTARTFDGVQLAAQVMRAFDSQAVANCFGTSFTQGSGAKGSFTVTAEAAEPTGADQVESIYGVFTGLTGKDAPKVARIALVAVRTSSVMTLITALSSDSPDPKQKLQAAVAAVAAHQTA